MSKRIFPNWNTFGVSRDRAWLAKQAAARAAARGTVIQRYRSQNVRMQGPPARLPVTLRAMTSRTEVKSFDVVVADSTALHGIGTSTSAEPTTAFAGITELNCVRLGSAYYNRIGSKIKVKSIRVAFDLQGNSDASPFANTVRYMLIYDRQPNGAFPAMTDILGINDSGLATNTPYASINIANRSRFSVIRDKVVEIDTARQMIVHVDEFCPYAADVEFKTNAGNIGDISTGAIYLVCFVGGVIPSTPYPIITNINARLRYFD